ncbi:hypothetical protein [Actinomyces howellii]|nr:hypothetical protein [Actinomyces howellii]
MSFSMLLSLAPLVAGCAGGGAGSDEVFTPSPAMVDVMLRVEDVPGADKRIWHEYGVYLTGCSYPEKVFNSLVSSPREGLRNTTAEYDVGDSTVYETLVPQVVESGRGGQLGLIRESLSSCDGREMEPYHATMRTSSGRVEAFSVLSDAGLPGVVAGYSSVVTADDGAQVTIQRIFVPILTEGDKSGLLSLAAVTEGGDPGSPTPMELLDPALERAGAIIDLSVDVAPTTVPSDQAAVPSEPTAVTLGPTARSG